GCYHGLSAKGGTERVGRSAPEAVVLAMILITVVDVFVARFLMVILVSGTMATPSLPLQVPAATAEHPSGAAIVFEDVSISFEDKMVLDGISFQLPRGETKAIFGVAGSGKSTILKMAIGLVKPDSGHIYTLGEDVTQMSEEALFELRRKVGIVFQESALYDSPTGGLDPVTSTTIIELIVKQRDVYKTSSLLVTHRLQDAFIMATHCFDAKSNHIQPVPPGGRVEVPLAFLILRDGKVIFDGELHELVSSRDEYIREYIS